MKKIILAIIAVVLLMNIFGGDNQTASALDFVSGTRYFTNKYLVIEGYLLNASQDKAITGIKNGSIYLCDANGKVHNKVVISHYLEKCTIPANGSVPYNFTIDLSDVDFNHVNEIHFEVKASCTYGKNVAVNTPSSPWNTNDQQEDTSNRYRCSWCSGTGVCDDCNGTGKSKLKDSIWESLGCTLCERTGDCLKCGGDGLSAY